MQVDVYESDAEALDAAAVLVESALAKSSAAHPAVAVAGGRGGRGIMLALTARVDLPWSRLRFCVVDEPLGAPSNRALLREHLLAPRGIAGPASTNDGEDRAQVWEAEVRVAAGTDVVFDVLVLDLGPGGEIGVLDADALAADAVAPIVRTADRIGLGPGALRRARHAVVIATGTQRSAAVAQALRAPGSAGQPAQLVLPGDRADWVLDRAAAAELLRDARPAPA